MISILMATWNGEKYIVEQIDSLLRQTVQNFTLYVSDDCSTDSTYAILQNYQRRYPDRISVARRKENSRGAKHNFFSLMTAHKDDYVMLCDQDDFWLPDKIEVTLTKMHQLETQYGTSLPLVVHTDLKIVDAELRVLNASHREAMNANYSRTRLKDAITQNILTGCTVMYNRALADCIQEEPPYAYMHDWWVMLIASAFGAIDHVNRATILYRQHDHNSIGAEDMRLLSYKLRRFVHAEGIRQALRGTYPQAKSFLDMYRSRLSPQQIQLLESYCEIPRLPKWRRVQRLFQLGTLKNNFSRQVAHILFV